MPPHADSTQIENIPVTGNSEANSQLPQDSYRIEPQSTVHESPAEYSPQHSTDPTQEQYYEGSKHELDDIPELEEEDWEEGQYADADTSDQFDTTHKSNRLRHEYSAQFQQPLQDNYYPPNNHTPGFEYHLPEPDYYSSDTRPQQHKRTSKS